MEFEPNFYTDIAIFAVIAIVSVIVAKILSKMFYQRLLHKFARNQATKSRIILRQFNSVLKLFLMLIFLILILTFLGDYFTIRTRDQMLALSGITFTLVVIIFINRIIQATLEYNIKKGNIPSTSIFANLVRIGIFFIMISILLANMGFSLAPVIATFGIGGLAIALALQDTLASFFAGIYIIISKQINLQDYIRLQSGEEGWVHDINWRNTTIKTRENNIIVVPNKMITNLIITNYSLFTGELTLIVPMGVHYNADLELVEELVIQTATEIMTTVEGGVKQWSPFIRYNAFADSAITFNVILRVSGYIYQGPVRHAFIKRVRKVFDENNITIPYPMRTLTFEKPVMASMVTIPS